VKQIFLPFILLLTTTSACLAQQDSTIIYYSSEGRETTVDSAFAYSVYRTNGNAWYGKTYTVKTQTIQSEGDYAELNWKKPLGSFKNYDKDGVLDNISVYNNGKLIEKTYYYKSGKKKSHMFYSDNSTEQKGWDEDGNEIPNFIVEREARFKGGLQGWSKYLSKHLNSNVPLDAGAPAGDYVTEVSFLVNKDGYISEVKAIQVPAKCKPCAAESVRVIMDGPNWEPAIQNNQPVVYRQKQMITYQVVEAKKKKD